MKRARLALAAVRTAAAGFFAGFLGLPASDSRPGCGRKRPLGGLPADSSSVRAALAERSSQRGTCC